MSIKELNEQIARAIASELTSRQTEAASGGRAVDVPHELKQSARRLGCELLLVAVLDKVPEKVLARARSALASQGGGASQHQWQFLFALEMIFDLHLENLKSHRDPRKAVELVLSELRAALRKEGCEVPAPFISPDAESMEMAIHSFPALAKRISMRSSGSSAKRVTCWGAAAEFASFFDVGLEGMPDTASAARKLRR